MGRELFKKLTKRIQSHFYLYDWLKPIVCRFFGHDITVHYSLYEMEKIVKNHDKTEVKRVKKRYDPYFVYSCKRCKKRLSTKRLARQLTYDKAIEMSERITAKKLR